MAKRTRCSNKKRLDGSGGKRQRNVNPKLSPYQRELKRNRLANQAPFPTSKSEKRKAAAKQSRADPNYADVPASARAIVGFMMKKKQRHDAKNAPKDLPPPADPEPTTTTAAKSKKKKTKRSREGAEPASEPAAPAAAAAVAPGMLPRLGGDIPVPKRKKREVQFDAPEKEGPGGDAPHVALTDRPERDFDDLVDVVKFGERVEAPPVFDVVPRAGDFKLLPVHKMGKARAIEISEQKRLAKLGLLASATQTCPDPLIGGAGAVRAPTPSPHVGVTSQRRPSTAKDFAEYREQVLQSYAKNRQKAAALLRANTRGKKRD